MDKKVVWRFVLIAAQAVVSVINAIATYYSEQSQNKTKGGD